MTEEEKTSGILEAFKEEFARVQCDLISPIGLSQPAISRQLQILVNSGLLDLKKNGNKRIYSLTGNAKIILLNKTPLKLSKRFQQ